MARIKSADEIQQLRAVIKVIGLGGAGGNAINRMVEAGLRDVELISANSDAQDLRRSRAGLRVQLGASLTGGLGVGGDPGKGRLAGMESEDQLREVLAGAHMVFITAGMGGGTGTGVSPVAARIARKLNALTVAVVTRPFEFEGRIRALHADNGIRELRECVDTLLVIPNDRIFGVIEENAPADEAFRRVDDVLRQAVQSISDIITMSGDINVDLTDFRAIMTNAGEAHMGVGEAEGPGRAVEAARRAVSSPLLENASIEGARGLLVNIMGSKRKLSLKDIDEAMGLINRSASPDARIKMGKAYDDSLGDRSRITVVATGFPPRKAKPPAFGPGKGDAKSRDRREGQGLHGASQEEQYRIPAFLRIKTKKLR